MASKNHFTVQRAGKGGRRRRCLNCQQHVFYGDRCPGCERELRQRRRRKPR